MQPVVHQFSVDEFQQFLASQQTEISQRFELIKGVVYEMPPIGAEHAYAVDILNRLLTRALGIEYIVRVQSPIKLEDSQPQPDLVVLHWSERQRFEMPTARECRLVIEVADSSVRYDQEIKTFLYAEAGITEYWLVNLPDDIVQQFRESTRDGYNLQRTWRRGEHLTTPQFTELAIPITDVVGGP